MNALNRHLHYWSSTICKAERICQPHKLLYTCTCEAILVIEYYDMEMYSGHRGEAPVILSIIANKR
jgi:hypothetical protein